MREELVARNVARLVQPPAPVRDEIHPLTDEEARQFLRAARDRLLARTDVRVIRFHDLRHTCATLLLARGVSARVVMDILGHSQIAVTMNTYGHVMPAMQQEAAGHMDVALTTDDGSDEPGDG